MSASGRIRCAWHSNCTPTPIRASDGKALWAETVHSRADRLFALEDSLAEQVAARLTLRLNGEARRELAFQAAPDPEAHRLDVNGRYEWAKRTREGFEKAAEYFRQAIDRDPRLWAGVCWAGGCYLLLVAYGYHRQLEMLPKTKAMALRALELQPSLADAHSTLGLTTQHLDWDWKEVERKYLESIRLAPSYSIAHHWCAEFLSIQGRFDESRREFSRVREIDPISPIIAVHEAQLYLFERQYDRSLALIEGRDKDVWRQEMTLPDCASEESDCRRMWTAWLPRRNPAAARAALVQLEGGRQCGQGSALRLHVRPRPASPNGPCAGLLERIVTAHGVWLITAKVNPVFDPLRGRPRMKAVLSRLHLA